MKLWILVLIGVLIFDLGFLLGAVWRSLFADMPTTKGVEADAAQFIMRGEM